jgi:predicted porin
MQKKIIALAVASALAVPAVAMAEATVYGQLNMAYEMTNTGSSLANAETSNVASNESRLGLKGSEDLGNGLSVLWQMEGDVNGDTGTESLFNRNTFAGLSSDFGTVILGNHDTPYKSSTRKMDAFKDTIADNRHMMGGSEDRLPDTVLYTSPDFNGLNLAVSYAEGANSSWSASYARDNYAVVVASADTATKVAASYNMDALTVGLIAVDADGAKHNYVSAQYGMSDVGTVKLAYTMAEDATQVALGYDHKLGDNTSVYALYTSVENDTETNGLGSPGSTAGFVTAVAGDDPSAIAIGMRMSF